MILCPGEDGYWVAECPSLPGCISQGKTKKEAQANIKEAIDLYVEVLEERGEPVPRWSCLTIASLTVARYARSCVRQAWKLMSSGSSCRWYVKCGDVSRGLWDARRRRNG